MEQKIIDRFEDKKRRKKIITSVFSDLLCDEILTFKVKGNIFN